jgi:dTDP-4-amino-4,6-dideoxygalactose transaminase
LGGVPIFVDTEINFPIMSVTQLEQYLTPKTKAIMPVHMNGRGVDMTLLNRFAKERNLVVIEDSAQALGSKNLDGQFLGTLSDAGCFSLSVAKIIATGQGGFIATKDPDLAKRFRSLRTHGVENTVEPDRWVAPGSNFRFTDILASIGIIQLGLLPERIKRSRQVYERYKIGLNNHPSVQLIENRDYEVGPYIEVLAQNRDGLRNYLRVQHIEIETRPFYPDLNTASYWVERNSAELPNSMKFAAHGLYLPSGPSILDEDIDYVLGAIWKFDS